MTLCIEKYNRALGNLEKFFYNRKDFSDRHKRIGLDDIFARWVRLFYGIIIEFNIYYNTSNNKSESWWRMVSIIDQEKSVMLLLEYS